ncbi:MAG: AEC family transporter [Candidatus Omnitrophica bacterium]|nr:AEC family transporter [Candidatus Omnitrophota bacterium]
MEIVAGAIIKLTFVAIFGFLLYKRKIIEDKVLDFLTFFVVNFTLPFLAFSHILENLKKSSLHLIFRFLFLSFLIFFIGTILGIVFSFRKSHNFKKEFISLISFQNCGYLPLNIALYLFPDVLRKEFVVYIFLYILGFDIIMWSVGSFFIFYRRGEDFKFKTIFTSPVIATLLAVFLVYTDIAKFFPLSILSPIKMIGEVSFVLSMIILGCWLAKMSFEKFYKNFFIIIEGVILKLIVMPAIFLAILVYFKISSLFGFFIILQAAMPSAASLPVVARLRSGYSEFVSGGVLVSHLFSILTVSVWLSLYMKISGFYF